MALNLIFQNRAVKIKLTQTRYLVFRPQNNYRVDFYDLTTNEHEHETYEHFKHAVGRFNQWLKYSNVDIKIDGVKRK